MAGAVPERLKKRRISLLIVAHVANDSYFGFLPPLLPLIVERMDLPLSLAGLLATTLSVTGAVGQPLFGYFADRIRKGWLLALGPLGGALLAFMLYMPNFWILMLLMLIAGSGSACFHPVASVIAGQSAGARKGFGMSLYVAGGRLGVGLGSGVATFIVTRWGIDAMPYASLFGIIIGAPLLFFSPPIREVGRGASQSFMQTIRMLRLVFRPLFLLWVVNLVPHHGDDDGAGLLADIHHRQRRFAGRGRNGRYPVSGRRGGGRHLRRASLGHFRQADRDDHGHLRGHARVGHGLSVR